jgi:hypothetical protein
MGDRTLLVSVITVREIFTMENENQDRNRNGQQQSMKLI